MDRKVRAIVMNHIRGEPRIPHRLMQNVDVTASLAPPPKDPFLSIIY